MPPNRSTRPFIWSRGMFRVPLKFMCSTQCEAPVRPGRSSRQPTPYQHQTDTSGAVWIGLTRIFSPLSRYASRTVDAGARSDVGMATIRLYRPLFATFEAQPQTARGAKSEPSDWPLPCTLGGRGTRQP